MAAAKVPEVQVKAARAAASAAREEAAACGAFQLLLTAGGQPLAELQMAVQEAAAAHKPPLLPPLPLPVVVSSCSRCCLRLGRWCTAALLTKQPAVPELHVLSTV